MTYGLCDIKIYAIPADYEATVWIFSGKSSVSWAVVFAMVVFYRIALDY